MRAVGLCTVLACAAGAAAENACTSCKDPNTCAQYNSACSGSTPYCVAHGAVCECKSSPIGVSGHVGYGFSPEARNGTWDKVSYSVKWNEMPATGFNCYASVQVFWEGAGGYMGSQFHDDGTQMLDFAIWDLNATVKNSHPLSPWCTRFGGEGEGAHCETHPALKVGEVYTFAVEKRAENATGVVWGVTFTSANGSTFDMGSLYWDEAAAGKKLGNLKPATLSFQEYYTGGNFNSSVGIVGPFGHRGGEVFAPTSAVCNSDVHHNCKPCIPGVGCGPPNALMYAGENVPSVPAGTKIW